MLVGVLALQGDFLEHCLLLSSLNVGFVEVRRASELDKCNALIIPGGESTVISKLLLETGLDQEIKKRVKKGLPLLGTCAGAIISAKRVRSEDRFSPLGLIDIEIERNSYGRQIDSFETELSVQGKKIRGIFIRAPVIRKVGAKVKVLASFDNTPVLVKEKNVIVSTFHPELVGEKFVHELLLKEVRK
ncbi:MAG: pyridoxal 5'-phosphate synthase glutaminase subunit PdxT [Candidatus Diapherotrites archaeon]